MYRFISNFAKIIQHVGTKHTTTVHQSAIRTPESVRIEEDLKEIKTLLAQYFMDKASDLADEIWEQKGLSEEAILGEHRRTQRCVNEPNHC